jgi:H+-transporting ATPase
VPRETPDAIDTAVLKKLFETHKTQEIDGLKILSSLPYDSERKRSTATVEINGKNMLVSLGAPQVIQAFVKFNSKEAEVKFESDVGFAAESGYRTLALAIKRDLQSTETEEKDMQIAGLLFLTDPLDETSKETLQFMHQNGIAVKMVTGDNLVIAKRTLKELGLQGDVLSEKETAKFCAAGVSTGNEFDNIAGFAQIMPKDKYELVKVAREHFVVASTGDGINDLPALKVANVGIAVAGAVSALKGLADIVLLGQGISVIKDAILESRKIFSRLYTYSIYRISESFRLIVTILILGMWYGSYPLLPLQIILLAFLNDIPIVSLALDRVKISAKPSEIKTKERFILSLLFGSVGVLNSVILFFLMMLFGVPLAIIQTMFFLKLTVSGHALIFVAHTKERWWKFLPSKEVIIATLSTQVLATILALTGFLMPEKISWQAVVFVWLWALIWMQVSELMKDLQKIIYGAKL